MILRGESKEKLKMIKVGGGVRVVPSEIVVPGEA